MMHRCRLAVISAALLCPPVSQAQSLPVAQAGAAPPSSPWDPAVAVPPTRYRSVFTSSSPAGPDGPIDWKRANATVRAIGGWRTYAREAQADDASLLAGELAVPGAIPRDGARPLPRLE